MRSAVCLSRQCYLSCINIVTGGMIIYDQNLAYAKEENNLAGQNRLLFLTYLSFVVFLFYERVKEETNCTEMYVCS